ncbi:phytoene desaturase family protein [Cohnella boryungensis]|uniref:Phytoene desaturase family protein n=1 Tax=Cohnella boryungensis TaxID=768479 RepID=A0ABV8S572_9BACL
MRRYDAVIIGGGLAGLIAAIELAEAGKTALVLEKSGKLGGRAMTVNKNGALFNLGGHALYAGGEADRLFRRYGLKLTGGSPAAKGTAIWNGQLAPLPGDPLSLLSSKLLGWLGKGRLVRLLLKIAKADDVGLRAVSLREWAEREIGDPMVRHIFYALCRTATYTQDPDYQSAGPALKQVRRSLKAGGVKYVDGGWQSIVDQLRDKAAALGVRIHSGASVQEIRHERGATIGVRCADGAEIAAAAVISTASPAATFAMTPGAEGTALRRWKEEARPMYAASLDLALRRLPTADRHLAIGLDRPIFFAHHSRVARLSENGTIVVHVMKYNGLGGQDAKADERQLEQTMSLLHPGWEKEVAARQYLPNIAVVHDYPHIGRTFPDAGPEVPEIRGLCVAGDWASHGELLVDAAAASALRAARLVATGDWRLREAVSVGSGA